MIPQEQQSHTWLCPACIHVMTEEQSKSYQGCPTGIHLVQHIELCQWESVVPGPCTNRAQRVSDTGKRLCNYHARCLERRFGVKFKSI